MATASLGRVTVTMPMYDMDFFVSLAKKLNWATSTLQEDSPYDKEFVKKIKSQEEQEGVKIEVKNLWN